MRRLGLPLLTLVLMLVVMEAIAWIAFATGLRGMAFRWRDLDAVGSVPTQAEMDIWRTWGWDRELGWLRRGDTEETVSDGDGPWSAATDARGARREPYNGGTAGLVSAYGDSFTFGHEVNDDQTWPHDLSELLDTRVDNWGVSGWGPDQAVLRIARNLPSQRTDVVVLAVMSETIARLLSSYRPFLTREVSMKMAFKPMLTVHDGIVAWLPSPMVRADTPDDWVAALAQARTTDVWYRENQERVRLRFPYLFYLPAALIDAARHSRVDDLYERPDAVARLDFVTDELVRLARVYDFVPVLLFIPDPGDLRRFTRGEAAGYQHYLAALRARQATSPLRIVDVLEHTFDAARFNRKPFKDHPSPYGQEVIADTVAAAIADIPAVEQHAMAR